jgi:hypothetical protein
MTRHCRKNPTNARVIVIIVVAIAALFHFVIVFAVNTANAAQR